jgi:hypothetical protein
MHLSMSSCAVGPIRRAHVGAIVLLLAAVTVLVSPAAAYGAGTCNTWSAGTSWFDGFGHDPTLRIHYFEGRLRLHSSPRRYAMLLAGEP